MFERCDADTMTVIDTAITEARALGHNHVGTEHMLVALVRHRDLLPPAVGGLLPADAESVRAAIDAVIDGPQPRDEDLLASLGIDLEGVRAAVRRTFGPDAIEQLAGGRVRQPWQPWRRPHRRCMSILASATQLSFMPRAKRALEHASAEAARRGMASIAPWMLLLGMVDEERALSNKLLQDLGVPPADLRAAILRAAS